MRWPEGLFWNRFTGRWEGERRAERRTERDGEIARERKSTTQGSFWGRGRMREGEKRIRPIETWHDRVSEDGCLCISHCLHQRQRNTTHTHSASSYKLHCSLIKATVRTAAISGEPFPFMVGGKPFSAEWSPIRYPGIWPEKTYSAGSRWRKDNWQSNVSWVNCLLNHSQRKNTGQLSDCYETKWICIIIPVSI